MAEENLDINSENLDFTEGMGEPTPSPSTPSFNFVDAMNSASDKSFNDVFAPKSYASPLDKINAPVGPGVGYAGDDIDLYRFQDDFDPLGFNPADPKNYERWTAAETWGSALGKGFDSFASRFGHTFTDYWKDYGRMFDALIHWDSSLLQPSP